MAADEPGERHYWTDDRIDSAFERIRSELHDELAEAREERRDQNTKIADIALGVRDCGASMKTLTQEVQGALAERVQAVAQARAERRRDLLTFAAPIMVALLGLIGVLIGHG
jgi:hypothetical protein